VPWFPSFQAQQKQHSSQATSIFASEHYRQRRPWITPNHHWIQNTISTMDGLHARNDALDVNPQAGETHLSEGGSSWLWAVMSLFGVAFLAYYLMSFRARNGEKIFHYLFTIMLLVATISYFAMASGLAYSVIPTHLRVAEDATYQVFFAKYILWVVAFPAIIIALGVISGVSWATILFNIFLSWVWIISYLCSAYTRTRYKWGFYAFGTVAYLILAFQTIWQSRSAARRFDIGRDHSALSSYVNLLWFLYPIAFAVSEGGNVIGVTGSMIFFGILDLLLLCGIAFAFLFLSRRWDYGRMNLHFTQYGRVNATDGNIHPEKHAPGSSVPTGTTTSAPATRSDVHPTGTYPDDLGTHGGIGTTTAGGYGHQGGVGANTNPVV
jgi:bacteriorhodopsin